METIKKSRFYWFVGLFIFLVAFESVAFAWPGKKTICGEPKKIKPPKTIYYKFLIDDNDTISKRDDSFLIYRYKECKELTQVFIVNRLKFAELDDERNITQSGKFTSEEHKQKYINKEFGELIDLKWRTDI